MMSGLGRFRLIAPLCMEAAQNSWRSYRKKTTFVLTVILLTAIFNLAVLAESSLSVLSGGGTKGDPYIIEDYDDLCVLRDNVNAGNSYNGAYFIQTKDIVFPDGVNWVPIGTPDTGDGTTVRPFVGNYDGKGHNISNILCDATYAGLFVQMDGEVRNICIESGRFSGSHASSIVNHGGENAVVINCCNKAEVVGERSAEGVAGHFNGNIYFCWNFGEVSGENVDSITAGIATGAANIVSSYYVSSSGDTDIVSPAAFSGTMTDSCRIANEEIPERLDHVYAKMFQIYSQGESDILVNRETIKFPIYDETSGLSLSLSFEPKIFAQERRKYQESFLSVISRRYSFEGDGTEDNPFLVDDYEDLCLIRDCAAYNVGYNGCFFKQTADIRFPDDANWQPIVNFYGTYDGAGHVLENIYCETGNASLFQYLNGEIRNLGIESGRFSGTTATAFVDYGYAGSRLVNCYNKADVYGVNGASGLVNNFNGQMICCWNFGDVSTEKPDVPNAGILLRGDASADIRCSYSVSGIEPFIYYDYSGKADQVGLLDTGEVAAKIGEVYSRYQSIFAGEEDDGNSLGLIYIPEYIEGGGFRFTDKMVDTHEYGPIGFVPIIFMSLVVIILAVAVIRTLRRGEKQSGCEKLASPTEAAKKKARSIKACIPSAVSAVLTLSMLCGGVFVVDRTLRNKNVDGITTLQNYYEQEQGKVDVLFVGSSRVGLNIDLETLWSSYGISSYNLWASAQPFWGSYYFLKEAIDFNPPKLVVLEMQALSYGETFDDYRKLTNTAGYRFFSENRVGAVSAMVEKKSRLDYLLGLPEYHMRYHELEENDFKQYPNSERLIDDKGDYKYYTRYKTEVKNIKDVLSCKAVNEKQEYYLRAILNFCKEKNIPIILLKTPVESANIMQPYLNYAELIAREYDVPLLNYMALVEEIDLRADDFLDGAHLNVWGARKVSEHLGNYIMENYGDIIKDHRGDSAYDSWEIFAHNMRGEALHQVNNNEDYFEELKRGGQTIKVIIYKMSEELSEGPQNILSELEGTEHEILRHNIEQIEGQTCIFTFGSDELMVTMSYTSCDLALKTRVNSSS